MPQFFLCSMSGGERDLSTGYESNRRRVDRIPFSGNSIDFPKWDYQFRVFASQLGCGPLLVPALSISDEESLISDNKKSGEVLLGLLVLSCDGPALDILQYEMMEQCGRSAWLRIQARYAGSTNLKIGALYVDLFRPVTLTDPDLSILAINRWFAGWKSLKALGHELGPKMVTMP